MPKSALSTIPDKTLIEEVALVRGINEAFIEKDWYATQVIKLVAEKKQEDLILVFTGGTALSKAHKLWLVPICNRDAISSRLQREDPHVQIALKTRSRCNPDCKSGLAGLEVIIGVNSQGST